MTSGYAPRFKPGKDITFVAANPIAARQVVVLTGDYTVDVAGASATKVIGVATNDVAAGDRVVVSSGGVQRPVASGAIAAGDRVATAASGKVATVANGTNSIGTALAAAADGAFADIRFDV